MTQSGVSVVRSVRALKTPDITLTPQFSEIEITHEIKNDPRFTNRHPF